jgi:hypothetical protein
MGLGVPYESIFTDQEWSLLVGLPQSVVTAASAAEQNSERRTLIEGEAGLTAIADGRTYGSPLVERVAQELVDRLGGDPELGEEPAVVVPTEDPANAIAECLRRAGQAMGVLAAKLDDGDSGAYRHWLVTIAESVAEAAPSGVLGVRDPISESEQDFVRELSKVLGD